MQMVNVSSSAIWAVGYDERSKQMAIIFTSGGHPYLFCGVPANIYYGLLSAASKGTYYHQYIRDRYQCF